MARRLSARWQVLLVERDAATAAAVTSGIGGTACRVTVGDGTSRLVLERAEVSAAAALVAMTGDDEANFECARIARELLGVRRVLALVHDPTRLARFSAAGIEPVLGSGAIATLIANRLERAFQAAVSVGLGQGEIVEVMVESTSPVLGQPLRSFEPRDWIVAAVYREEELLIPHGDTEIRVGDRLLLVGRPAVLPAVADYLRGSIPRFPQPYGSRLVALLTPRASAAYLAEVKYLASAAQISGIDLVDDSSEPGAVRPAKRWRLNADDDHTHRLLERALAIPSLGCLVLPSEPFGLLEAAGLRGSALDRALGRTRWPVLVARGSFPYRRILLPVTPQRNQLPAVRLAAGLAKLLGASLTAVTVTPPEFVVGGAAIGEQARALADAVAVAETHRLAIATEQLAGNPIREILSLANEHDLVVLAHRPGDRSWRLNLRPDISAYLAQGCARSTLILPVWPGGERVG
ncbi:MAG: NAD-binding protein [Chloroflexi bacterium]|nr:NAD-binding protein [Chloroflexota bacterium]